MHRILLAVATVLLVATALSAAARKWTSKDGRFSTEAELVESDDTSVTLKKTSGDTVTVPLERLSELDRHFLNAQKKKAAAAKEKAAAAKEKADAAKENMVSYGREVQPFLAQYCSQCHNPAKAKEGYDVTSYATLTRPGKNGALVVPSKPDQSRLVEVMRGMSKSMPPSKSPQPSPEEITKIAAWIEAGAKDDAGGGTQSAPGKARAKRGRS